MAHAVNAGARLDRLPISGFHYRIFWLVGAGMFFDGYDLYVGASVLGAAVQSKFAVLGQVPQFISWTFVGMTIGSVLASDAYFPFADGVEAAIEAGVTAVIQPGGSIRDADVIAAANASGIAMVFTGMRHFWH